MPVARHDPPSNSVVAVGEPLDEVLGHTATHNDGRAFEQVGAVGTLANHLAADLHDLIIEIELQARSFARLHAADRRGANEFVVRKRRGGAAHAETNEGQHRGAHHSETK